MSEQQRDIRREGRELALAILCHLESYRPTEFEQALAVLLQQTPQGDEDGERIIAELAADTEVAAWAQRLVHVWHDRRAEIDELIADTSRSWKMDRMDRVDRNVIRLASAELLARPTTPRAAIVAEAVRLAGRYGGERSVRFINGVVEALAQRIRPEAPA